MITETIGTGRTVDEAIDLACEELGIERENAEVEILELPASKRGFLGLKKATPAKVKVSCAMTKVTCAKNFIETVLDQMGLGATQITVKEEKDSATFTLEGEGLGVIIGRRGETLDAFQYLAGLVANKMEGDYFRITIDSGKYREKREKTLESLAVRLAQQAVKTGRTSTLEPMNPYERRVIHAAVQNVAGATSSSVGEEPNRRVVISSTNPGAKKEYGSRGGRGGRGGYNKDRRGGDRERKPYRNDKGYSTKPNAFGPPPEKPSQAPKAVPANEAADKPLYSKIEL